jgi:hypothetical protein
MYSLAFVYPDKAWMSSQSRVQARLPPDRHWGAQRPIHARINVLSISKRRFTRPRRSTPVQHCSRTRYSTDFVLFQAKEPRTVLKLLIIPMSKTNSQARAVVHNHEVHRWTKHLSARVSPYQRHQPKPCPIQVCPDNLLKPVLLHRARRRGSGILGIHSLPSKLSSL